MKQVLENEPYGYISGRMVFSFVHAAVACGVSEEALKSVSLTKSYESTTDPKNLCYWNDFVRLVECAHQEVGSNKGMVLIGNKMIHFAEKMPYTIWTSKLISLHRVCKLTMNASYNFLNWERVCEVFPDRLVMDSKMQHQGDEFNEAVFHMFGGMLEFFPTSFGYAPMKSVSFETFPDEKRLVYTAYFPEKRSLWKYLKGLVSMANPKAHTFKMLDHHAAEVLELEVQSRKELNTLYGLIENIRDAVLFIRGGEVLIQNKAFNTLCRHRKVETWKDHFTSSDEVESYIREYDGNQAPISTLLRREGLPDIEVFLSLESVRKENEEYEAILRANELAVPRDPMETLTAAREMERKSLARDIHDSLGQLLTATSFQLASLEHSEENPRRSEKLSQVSGMVRDITLYSRKFTRQLDLLIDECSTVYEAVEIVKEEFTVISGVSVANKMKKSFSIDHHDAIRHLSYVLQEALNNAYRHGRATEISLSTPSKSLWVIEDNGGGMKQVTAKEGLGLRSMEYRVSTIGGTMRIEKSKHGGVRIECSFEPATCRKP